MAKDLEGWMAPPGERILLQYVDDLMIATTTTDSCLSWIVSLLNFWGLSGYKVLKQKAQILQKEVTYLRYEISGGQCKLGTERKKAICSTPLPHTAKELRTFLGMTGWCWLWILNYGILVKALYQMIKGNPKTLTWTKESKRAFQTLKEELLRAPALGLPNVSKPFLLFSHGRQGMALGVLAQNISPCRRAVAYFSKQLDEVSKGWPSSLRAVSAMVINIQEAHKFTLGQKMTVFVSISYSSRCTGTEREPLVISLKVPQIPGHPSGAGWMWRSSTLT